MIFFRFLGEFVLDFSVKQAQVRGGLMGLLSGRAGVKVIVKKVKIANEVMAHDFSPVAMFF